MSPVPKGWRRLSLAGATEDKLYFAQVREDPLLEIEALHVGAGETVVVVSSGGCTALSLLAAGAGRVVAVDVNATQNHLVELKAAAVARLSPPDAIAFLGASPMAGSERLAAYGRIATDLSSQARSYWELNPRAIERGVLGSGRSERFIGAVVRVVETLIHPPSRIRRLLACTTLEEQEELYRAEWDNCRWRLGFRLGLNRTVFRKAFNPAFFDHVERPSFADHFHASVEHGLTKLAVADNYFAHQMLTGRYPAQVPGGVPPYLSGGAAEALAGPDERLSVVDGSFVGYLRTCAPGSIAGYALSNIGEWLDAPQLDQLMAEVVRTAATGARLVFRNFVGWTEVPARFRAVIVEDRIAGEDLIARDRSLVQRRIAVCRVADGRGAISESAREAGPEDNSALLALAESCAMEGDIGLCVARRPDFFALNRLEGDSWWLGVVDGSVDSPVGCIAVAEREVYLCGRPTRTMYVSDLKVDPDYRGSGVADTLSTYALERCLATGGEDIPTFLAILAGNRSMERRMAGPRGLPSMKRFATVRSHSVSLLWRRRPPSSGAHRVGRAQAGDAEEMAALWQRVAPERQLAPVHDAASLAAFIEAAPGLDPTCYWLARDSAGALAGFLALWDQASFKQMRVTSYSPALGAFRRGFNAVAPFLGATRLPPPGEALRYLTAIHVCVPGSTPGVLRSLLIAAYNELRGQGYSFLTIGLDVTDPLAEALSGLLAQPTDVWVCVGSPGGPYTGPDLAGRPVHHEIALV